MAKLNNNLDGIIDLPTRDHLLSTLTSAYPVTLYSP